jgi:hypothetical protein
VTGRGGKGRGEGARLGGRVAPKKKGEIYILKKERMMEETGPMCWDPAESAHHKAFYSEDDKVAAKTRQAITIK